MVPTDKMRAIRTRVTPSAAHESQNQDRVLAILVLASAGVIAALLLFPRRPPSVPRTLRARWTERHVDKPNVMLISLDTTRADHLGCYGYANARTPATDAVARRGILFAQAATPVPLTLPAHSSLMTGLYPTYHGVRLNGNTALGQSHTTMAEALSRQGYDTAAFVGAFVLDGRWGLNQGFRLYDDQFDMKKFKHLDLAAVQRPGDQVMDAAIAWLEGRKDRPFFAWIHLYDAHSPYEPPEPLRSEFRGRGLAGSTMARSRLPINRSAASCRGCRTPVSTRRRFWSSSATTANRSAVMAKARTGTSSMTPSCTFR